MNLGNERAKRPGKVQGRDFFCAVYDTLYTVAAAQFEIGTSVNKWNFSKFNNRKYCRASIVKLVNFYS
jgi:hypothetical protein